MAIVNESGHIICQEITKRITVQANYLASNQDEYIVDDGISIYTGIMPWNWGTPPCSHTEVGFWIDGQLWFFSSTSRKELGGKNGTRWIRGDVMLRNPERWLLQEKPTSHYSIAEKLGRANSLVGLGYDFYGVGADFINPIRVCIKRKLENVKLKKIYCSKAVHAVDTGILTVYSPRRRHKWAKKNGYITVKNTKDYLLNG